MAHRVSCACGAEMNVPDKYRGRKVRCRECGDPLQVPGLKQKRGRTTSTESSNSLPPRMSGGGRQHVRQSASTVSASQLSIIARVVSVVVMIVLSFLVAQYNSLFDEDGNYRQGVESHEQSLRVLIGAAVLIGVGVPSVYVAWHGVRTGPAASRVRKKGVRAMLIGGGLTVLGIMGVLVVGMIGVALGGIVIMGGFLVPLGVLIAGIVNTITGVDIVATLQNGENEA